MIDVILQHESTGQPLDERQLWLPPQRMRRYQWAKVVGGSLMIAIFAGWMAMQWESVFSRMFTGFFLVMTLVIVAGSILGDLRRSRGRQLAIDAGSICLIRPDGTLHVALAHVACGQWIDHPEVQAGLWLLDSHDKPLVHIDTAFLASEQEARDFVGWARRLTGLALDTRWPVTAAAATHPPAPRTLT